jgi:hypothetical protein
VGMLFSSFCWHYEDHCFYSVNYLHQYGKLWSFHPDDDANFAPFFLVSRPIFILFTSLKVILAGTWYLIFLVTHHHVPGGVLYTGWCNTSYCWHRSKPSE